VTLLTVGKCRRYRSIAGTRRPVSARAQQQTSRTPTLLSIDGIDRQADGRTDTRPLHTMRLASIIVHVNKNCHYQLTELFSGRKFISLLFGCDYPSIAPPSDSGLISYISSRGLFLCVHVNGVITMGFGMLYV